MGHTSFMFNFSMKILAEIFAFTLILLVQNRLCDAIPETRRQKNLYCLDE